MNKSIRVKTVCNIIMELKIINPIKMETFHND